MYVAFVCGFDGLLLFDSQKRLWMLFLKAVWNETCNWSEILPHEKKEDKALDNFYNDAIDVIF